MRILKFEEKKDGSAIMTYKLNKTDEKILKLLAKNAGERFSKKFCNKTILNAIKDMVKDVK